MLCVCQKNDGMKHDGKAGEQYMQRAERMRKLKMRWEAKWAYMVLKIERLSDVTLFLYGEVPKIWGWWCLEGPKMWW